MWIDLPGFIGGNNPKYILERTGLVGSPNPDGTWTVRRRAGGPDLVKDPHAGGPWLNERKLYLLDGYAGHQDYMPEAQAMHDRVEELLAPRRAAGDKTAWLYGVQSSVMVAGDSEVAAKADHADANIIGRMTGADDVLAVMQVLPRNQLAPVHNARLPVEIYSVVAQFTWEHSILSDPETVKVIRKITRAVRSGR